MARHVWSARFWFLLALLVVGVGVSLTAAITYPITVHVAWDPNPSTDAVTSYTVTVDGATVAVVDPLTVCTTSCLEPISVPNSSSHTACVTSTNQWGSSSPTCVGFVVAAPGNSSNVKITK